MIYLSEQLKSCRKSHDYTQEDVAAALHVSAQSVSKWERGETYPDIELLPALANLFKTSIDTLMGMDRIYADQQRGIAFSKAHAHFRTGDYSSACDVLQKQLDIFPNDMSLMSELAFCMSFDDNLLQQAIDLCEMALQRSAPLKVQHTVRAALSLMYEKLENSEKALSLAGHLPHTRESREEIVMILKSHPSREAIDSYMRDLVLGE